MLTVGAAMTAPRAVPCPAAGGVGEGGGLPTPYYERGGAMLFQGDCRDILPLIPAASVDLVITDPPYGTTNLEWDGDVDLWPFWEQMRRVCKPSALQVVFSAQPFTTDLIRSNRDAYRYELIWHKTMATGFLDANRRPLRAHENIIVFCEQLGKSIYNPQKNAVQPHRRHVSGVGQRAKHYGKMREYMTGIVSDVHPRSVLEFSNGHGFDNKSLHPTAKPLPLIEWLMASFSDPGMTVLDCFAGSGPVLRAAKNLGRSAIGIELNEAYCRLIVDRLRQDVLPLPLPRAAMARGEGERGQS